MKLLAIGRIRALLPLAPLLMGLGCQGDVGAAERLAIESVDPRDRVPNHRRFDAERLAIESVDPRDRVPNLGIEAPMIRVSPLDLSTYTTDFTARVVVLDLAATLSADEQADWRSRVRLVEWPEGSLVRAEVIYTPPDGAGTDHGHRFDVMPAERLDARWYALDVDIGERGREAIQAGLFGGAAGHYLARFRPDTHPIPVRVGTAPHEDGTTLVTVELSERVMPYDADSMFDVRVGERAVACRMLTRFEEPIPNMGAESTEGLRPPGPEAQHTIRVACDFASTETVDLTIGDSFLTVEGTPIFGRDGATPAQVSWNPEELAAGEEGERTLNLAELAWPE